VKQISVLREELNWYYHRIEIEQLRPDSFSPERVEELQQQARGRENEFLRVLRETPTSPDDALQPVQLLAGSTVKEVRAALGEATLIEYFSVRDQIFAVVLR